MTDSSLVYPAPCLIVGMGRFGLAVLERLGEDWQQLRLSGADLSLKNLRLFWLHPKDEGEDCWRREERRQLKVARYIQGSDLPSIALDFVLLRTLGLVRYHHGLYQVAVPQDRGALRVSDLGVETGEEAAEQEERLVRRRFFEWQNLDPDPLHAAERLRRKAERQSSLDLFIAPLINRIRQGHSPWILLAAIMRCRSLAQGRDPAPWRWVRRCLVDEDGASHKTIIPRAEIEKARKKHRDHDILLDGLAPPPLRPHEADSEAGAWEFVEPEIAVPTTFLPHPSDPEAPIDPFHLLNENWESTGWATDLDEGETGCFNTLKVSHFRLGLFDHALTHTGEKDELTECLGRRLELLGDLLHKGLVRLWVDLNREQVEERTPLPLLRRHEALDEALEQSLKMLYELTIRPLEQEDQGEEDKKLAAGLRCTEELPARPTRFLRSLCLDPDPRAWEEGALERRLAALGLADPERRPPAPRRLLRQVPLSPNGAAKVPPETGGGLPSEETGTSRKIEEPEEAGNRERAGGPTQDQPPNLRKVLNQEVRDVLDFSYLAAYRKKATRTPPRLTVFVVGDMSEAFTRVKMTEVLRDAHSELLRSFSSMFELHRTGFDRALSIVPILWMPHPADPFGGEPLEKTRLEEAVIIDAVHRVRRWVESVLPAARRRISQIFINGRVTDNAVLTLRDSIQQTRDFLAFQIRNDLTRDDWLRRTAVGPGGDDFFASFACCEIEFPAERAREYLANRMARDCLHKLRGDAQWRGAESAKLSAPATTEELIGEASAKLKQDTEGRAQELADTVWGALPQDRRLHRCIPQREVLKRFGEPFEKKLWTGITRLWRELAQRRGRMDDLVDSLRRQTSQHLRTALPEIRRHSDDDIEQTSTKGLPAVLSRLEDRRREAFGMLQATEEERRQGEEACQRHRKPRRLELTQARKALVAAAEAKPDCGPQRLGLLAWGLLTPVTGVLLATLLQPWLLRWALPVSALVLIAVAGLLLWLYTHRGYRRLEKAIEEMAAAVRRLVAGGNNLEKPAPSLRSFFEMRLRLTSTLARRSYTLHVYEQSAVDEGLGQRLQESLDIQEHRMIRRAEALGVRPPPPGADERDDLRSLFVRRAGERIEKLINPDQLLEYYRSRARPDDLPLAEFLERVGGFREWRKTACLSDAEAVMKYGRDIFEAVAARPITELDYFSEEAAEHLREFVRRNYSNIGFGAKFLGYEGLDPDGVRLAANAGLVADRLLIAAYERAEERAEERGHKQEQHHSRPRTLERLVAGVRPNAAYMFSLVQGIRAHSVHNLKRFESFHDRSDDTRQSPPAIHLLTEYQDCGEGLLYRVRSNGDPASRPDPGGEAEIPQPAREDDDEPA